MGNNYRSNKEFQLAIDAYDQASELEPENEKWDCLKALVYSELGDTDRQLASWENAIAKSERGELRFVLALTLQNARRDIPRVYELFNDAIARDSSLLIPASLQMGLFADTDTNTSDAMNYYEHAMEAPLPSELPSYQFFNFDLPSMQYTATENFVRCAITLGREFDKYDVPDMAEAMFSLALAVQPTNIAALDGLQQYLKSRDANERVRVTTTMRRAYPNEPSILASYSHSLLELVHADDTRAAYGHREPTINMLVRWLKAGTLHPRLVPPLYAQYMPFSSEDVLKIAKAWADQFYGEAMAFKPPVPYQHQLDLFPDRRLRVGYLSGDVCMQKNFHPLGRALERMFDLHDLRRFQITIFCLGVYKHPNVSDPYDVWMQSKGIDVVDLNAPGLHGILEGANAVNAMRTQILVDLHGYTANHRLQILALHPAPVQLTYMGYLGTLNADYVPSMLADRMIVTPDLSVFHSEKLAYMPYYFATSFGEHEKDAGRHFECTSLEEHDDVVSVHPNTTIRKAQHLPVEHFVFCNFNQMYKFDPILLKLMQTIMKRVPQSTLWLLEQPRSMSATNGRLPAIENIRKKFAMNGIPENRLQFAGYVLLEDYLRLRSVGDLGLDTFEYNGVTSTLDLLFTGVPTVTVAGEKLSSRMGASFLTQIDLPLLMARTYEDYVDIAVALSKRPDVMRHLRRWVVHQRRCVKAFDTARWVRGAELKYLQMWDVASAGHEPMHLF